MNYPHYWVLTRMYLQSIFAQIEAGVGIIVFDTTYQKVKKLITSKMKNKVAKREISFTFVSLLFYRIIQLEKLD